MPKTIMELALDDARKRLESAIRKAMHETLEADEIEEAHNLERLVEKLGDRLGQNGLAPRKRGQRRPKPAPLALRGQLRPVEG